MSWSDPVSNQEAYKRAGGRRHYNAIRRFQRAFRRMRVAKLLYKYGGGHGVQARIARELGVSRSTISRDVAAIFEDARPCPCCGRPVPDRP